MEKAAVYLSNMNSNTEQGAQKATPPMFLVVHQLIDTSLKMRINTSSQPLYKCQMHLFYCFQEVEMKVTLILFCI